MSGSFTHAQDFRKESYRGYDGKSHYELHMIDGDCESMGNSTWIELKRFFSELGIPEEAWPEFPNHQFTMDIPVAEVDAKNEVLRSALHKCRAKINSAQIPPRFRAVLGCIERGEKIFFTPV